MNGSMLTILAVFAGATLLLGTIALTFVDDVVAGGYKKKKKGYLKIEQESKQVNVCGNQVNNIGNKSDKNDQDNKLDKKADIKCDNDNDQKVKLAKPFNGSIEQESTQVNVCGNQVNNIGNKSDKNDQENKIEGDVKCENDSEQKVEIGGYS
jgi:hypothetical protein